MTKVEQIDDVLRSAIDRADVPGVVAMDTIGSVAEKQARLSARPRKCPVLWMTT